MNQKHYGSIAVAAKEEEEDRTERPCHSMRPSTFLIGIAAFVVVLLVSFRFQHSSSSSGIRVSSLLYTHDDNEALFYDEQLVDHFSNDGDPQRGPKHWRNKYFLSTRHYGGPSCPIFLVVGGEGGLDRMLYPFINNVLARKFKAAVVQIEHRFYGVSQPVVNASTQDLLRLLTPHQAMADMVQLTQHLKETELQCAFERSSSNYCPVITVGASYPGFLSAMFRIVYPNFVDIAYASSATLLMYAQVSDQNVFYDIVTASAERTSPGCAAAVRTTLLDVLQKVDTVPSLTETAKGIGVCQDTLPAYIQTQSNFQDDIVYLVSLAFSDYNMDNYPPSNETGMYQACRMFQNDTLTSFQKMDAFLQSTLLEQEEEQDDCDYKGVDCNDISPTTTEKCFDLMSQLDLSNATIDDTAVDTDGKSWEFQTCTQIIFLAGFSNECMFPPRHFTYKELANDCQEAFGVTPQPHKLVDEWGFDHIEDVASYILFTNGLQDMWSGGSILTNLSSTVIALNFENGAHHSDLTHEGPTEQDTDDIRAGFVQISEIISNWLADQSKSRTLSR